MRRILLLPLAVVSVLQLVLAAATPAQPVPDGAPAGLRALSVALFALAGLGLGLAVANGWRGCRRGLRRWLVVGGLLAVAAPLVWGEVVDMVEPLHHLVRLLALVLVGVLAWVGARREPAPEPSHR